MKRVGLLLLVLGCSGCQSVVETPPSFLSSFSSAPLPEAECDRGHALLRYHMSAQQRAALTERLRSSGCADD